MSLSEGDLPPLRPFSLTFVEYERGSLLGFACALLSLTPPLAVAAHCALLASRRDLHTAALLAGVLANVAANGALKAAVRDPRPTSPGLRAPEAGDESGWPSAHAQFCFFLAAYAAAWALSGRWRVRHAAWRALLAAAGLALAAAVAASRVLLGYHTASQVVAGAAIGAALGLGFFGAVELALRPRFAAVAAWPACVWLRVRDCSEVDVMQVEYEAVVAAAAEAAAARRAKGR